MRRMPHEIMAIRGFPLAISILILCVVANVERTTFIVEPVYDCHVDRCIVHLNSIKAADNRMASFVLELIFGEKGGTVYHLLDARYVVEAVRLFNRVD